MAGFGSSGAVVFYGSAPVCVETLSVMTFTPAHYSDHSGRKELFLMPASSKE